MAKKRYEKTQMEDTSVPTTTPKKGESMMVMGASGTSIASGIIRENYLNKLSGVAGMLIYEKMRRGDAKIYSVLEACDMPIRATKWFIKPAEEDGVVTEEDKIIADFVEDDLFHKLEKTWDALLGEILTMIPFGHSVFEKTYGADEDEKIILTDIGFRKQVTITRWQTQNGEKGITQNLPTTEIENIKSSEVSIPAWKIVIFTHKREGANYEGISMLQPVYKHWAIKEELYRYDAVRHERQSVGVPVVYLPSGSSEEEKAEALSIVEGVSANEMNGIVMPGTKEEGWLFEFANMGNGNNTNLFESIKYHDHMISQGFQAQFTDIVNAENGSRALSESSSGIFLLFLESVCRNICDTINKFVIQDLVDQNFTVKKYPTLEFQKLGNVDFAILSSAISSLVGAGVLTPDEDFEKHIRKTFDLPEKMEGVEDSAGEDMGGNGMDPEEDNMDQEDIDSSAIEEELKTLEACEMEDVDEVTSRIFSIMEDDSAQFFRSMDAEAKKKISEGLIEYYKTNRKKGDVKDSSNIVKRKDFLKKEISTKSSQIKSIKDEYRVVIEESKKEIETIKAMKAQGVPKKEISAKVKTITEKLKAVREKRDSIVSPLSEIKSQEIQTRKNVIELLKTRKKEIVSKVKQIYADIKAKRVSTKDAIIPLKDVISSNSAKIKDIREQMKGLKNKDPRKDALKALIEGIKKESDFVKENIKGVREKSKGEITAKRAEIDKVRKESGLYCCLDDSQYMSESMLANNKFILRLQNECSDADSKERIKEKGFRFNDFEGEATRTMTFAERKVNFKSLSKNMEKFSAILEKNVSDITEKQKTDILAQVRRAVESNDVEAIGKIRVKYTGEMASAITEVQKEMFEIGKKSASVEMGVDIPATRAEVRGAMRVQNDAVVEKMANSIEESAKNSAMEEISKRGGKISDTTASVAVSTVNESVSKISKKIVADAETMAISMAVNMGRTSIFERYPEKVYAMQYSAILDRRTTDICRSLDGRVVKPGSPEFYNYAPPRHYRCRSVWVEILNDEQFKPDIGGVPKSIPADSSIDDATRKPGVKPLKDGPAIDTIKLELEERKSKLKALEDSGTYPKRQASHKARIEELENGLKGDFSEYTKRILSADGVKFS
jgi:SPP1 gp7 family putative phage head morphogenesis protein